jgi:hypothetical protein
MNRESFTWWYLLRNSFLHHHKVNTDNRIQLLPFWTIRLLCKALSFDCSIELKMLSLTYLPSQVSHINKQKPKSNNIKHTFFI